ncbi:MAG: hypothetical protein ACO3D0_11090 [Ilumatobacteraceae bacterium]
MSAHKAPCGAGCNMHVSPEECDASAVDPVLQGTCGLGEYFAAEASLEDCSGLVPGGTYKICHTATKYCLVVDDERSQMRNRALAEERLVTRLRSALHVDAPRRPTGPTKGSQRRRMDAKSRRGEVKRSRQRPTADG